MSEDAKLSRSVKKWFAGLVVLLLTNSNLSDQANAAARGEKMTKPYFFVNQGFGTLALIDGAQTIHEGNVFRNYTYFDDDEACYVIPKQERYRFVINHRLPEKTNREWFSFVSVVYFAKRKTDLISLFRNSKWIDEKGGALGFFYTNSYKNGLSPQKFVDLHLRRSNPEDRKKAKDEFERIAGKFHGKLKRTNLNSWEYAPQMVGPIKEDHPNVEWLSIKLFRYFVTAKLSSRTPVDFVVHRHKQRKFKIIAETPGIDGPPIRIERNFALSAADC